MGMQDIITTLHDFLVKWFTDADFRDQYDGDVDAALDDHGFDDVDGDTLLQCLPLVAEDLPLNDQRAVYDYISTVDVDNGSDVNGGSNFEVVQGGGYGGGGGHHGGGGDAAKHIHNIRNISETNYSYIDDRGDVTTNVNALGDVDFDQVVATGDGAVAADGDVTGVNTGTNNGVVAGDDVDDVDVTNVKGNGNTTTGDVGSGAVIVSGDDNVLANGSNVIDGDFQGQFVGGSVNNSNLVGDDAGVAAAGASAVSTGAVNVHGTQNNVEANDSAVHFGKGANVNDQSTDVDDSFNTDNSKHLDVDVDDSFNTDNSTEVKDSYNTDNSTNIDADVDVEVDDSFNTDNSTETEVKDSFNTDNSTDVDVDDSFNKDLEVDVEESFNTDNSTDIDADVEVEESFNTDNSVDDSDFIDAH